MHANYIKLRSLQPYCAKRKQILMTAIPLPLTYGFKLQLS
jgi:hypothetical protein